MADRPKIVVADFISGDLGPERAILGDLAEVVSLGAASEEELIGHVEDAAGIMMYHVIRLSEKSLGRLNQCRVSVRCGV